jgi:MYXO-CTERM domain-containing protein
MEFALTFAAVFAFPLVASADVLRDNGDTDGTGGYSMANESVFGAQRALLDDFEVQEGWIIQDFHTLLVWDTMPPGSGTDFYLELRPDAGGAPDPSPGIVTTGHIYNEEATGREWFGRLEAAVSLEFDDVALDPGVWWFYGYVIGPENAFMMIRQDITLSECWVDYDDLGGLQPGTNISGFPADLPFQITGIPVPGALALLGMTGLVRRRRRSSQPSALNPATD